MLIAAAEVGFNVGELRQSPILDIGKVLADGRNVRSIDDQRAARIFEDESIAVSKVLEGGRRTSIGIGMRIVDLPAYLIVVEKLKDSLGVELRGVIVGPGIESVALGGATGDGGDPVGNGLAGNGRKPAVGEPKL